MIDYLVVMQSEIQHTLSVKFCSVVWTYWTIHQAAQNKVLRLQDHRNGRRSFTWQALHKGVLYRLDGANIVFLKDRLEGRRCSICALHKGDSEIL